jgi:hypothetical protein
MEIIDEWNVALFDMDGTLCEYDRTLLRALRKLSSKEEPKFNGNFREAPGYIQRRADLIRASEDWWGKLPKLKLGWDVLEVAQELGYRIMILTQGTRKNSAAWSGKRLWVNKHLGPDVDLTITRDKGLVYGKVLVDDFPQYAERWLTWRKNGLVIMPANEANKGFEHLQVLRYDGTNLEDVRIAMQDRLKGPTRNVAQLLREHKVSRDKERSR